MKRILACIVILVFLNGCGSGDGALQRSMQLRERLLKANECCFDAVITADYTDSIYTFQLTCQADNTGKLRFTVTDPASISGIAGEISDDGAALTFDDQVLAFPRLADDQVTPVTAPWLFLNTLRSGYISSCGADGEALRVIIDDSYEENPLQLDIWLDAQDTPIRAEILYSGKRILSLDIKNFTLS